MAVEVGMKLKEIVQDLFARIAENFIQKWNIIWVIRTIQKLRLKLLFAILITAILSINKTKL